MIATFHTGNSILVLFFYSLCKLSYTFVYPLISWASRISAARDPKSCDAQSTLLIRYCDADEKVSYKAAQREYIIGFYSKQFCQLHATYRLFVAGFYQNLIFLASNTYLENLT